MQVASQAQTTALAPTTGTLQIGGDSYPNEFFAGRIDEVRIYSRALSAAEIQTDMNTAVGGTAPPDTSAPSAPAGLSATTASVSQINLAWSASTDNVGVTGYRVERCQGAGCTTFAQIATPAGTSFSDTGLAAATSYSYRARAVDAAGNLSAYSSTAFATTPAPDTMAPTVSMTAPATGATVSATTTITASAADNIGVVGVQFLLDGALLGAEQTGPYSLAWNTASAVNGSHTLSARARDAAGNTTTATSVTVTVANTQASGLVAAYGFNEGAGTTVTDLSGSGNTGTIGGGGWAPAGEVCT